MEEFRARALRLTEVMESVEARRGELAAATLRNLIPIWSVLAAMGDFVDVIEEAVGPAGKEITVRALHIAGDCGERIAKSVGLEDADLESARLAMLADVDDAVSQFRRKE